MRNLELPVQMSPCLRTFIALLLDESPSSVTGEIQGLRLALAISAESDSPRDEGEAPAHRLMDVCAEQSQRSWRWKSHHE